MPPKHKKSGGVATGDAAVKRKPLSPVAEEPPRRSNRLRRIDSTQEMSEPGVCLRPFPPHGAADSGAGHEELHKGVHEAREGVKSAMQELSEMQSRLQSAVKRQRMAVESSHLVGDADLPSRYLFNSRSIHQADNKVLDEKLTQGRVAPAPLEEPERVPADHDEAAEAADDINRDEAETIADVGEVGEGAVDRDRGAGRAPPVNSDYLPLPWKGRLGFACLNTYLRNASPPVFNSRTCRIASIVLHQHPLQHPSQPEHPTKNRPDESKPKDVKLGQKYVEELGLANARDIVKMLRWNDKFGIKFMRLSSEMFPFASHHEYGYSLRPFASETLAAAGAVAGELGHRLTTHPGQFTQLGSPREEVVTAAVRDLEYHDELLSLLQLPEQQDRDAVMILHMGGTFGDKAATLDRFRENYAKLSPSIKRRLVLENDDVSWSVHDLLPVCEELGIPLVLDFHHHNIVFDPMQLREGTRDIMELYPRIKATWTRKGISQKMHYSESCTGTVTPRDRRKHSARVRTLPPCPDDMDLMIEAKDKEQAVFELIRSFKLPGHEKINDVIPHERADETRRGNGKCKTKAKGTTKNGKKRKSEDAAEDDTYMEYGVEDEAKAKTKAKVADAQDEEVSPEDFGMGGELGRVYWPEGMEGWLRPPKRTPKRSASKTTKTLED